MLKRTSTIETLQDLRARTIRKVRGYRGRLGAIVSATVYRVLGAIHLALVTDAGLLIVALAPFWFGGPISLRPISWIFLVVYVACDLVRLHFLHGATISLGFPLVFLTLLADSPCAALLNAVLGSWVSELLRSKFLSRQRLHWFKALQRAFFYAGHHAVAGLGALIAYQLVRHYFLPWPAELENIIHVQAALAYIVVYALVSMLLIWPHDRRVRLFLAPGEELFVRVDFFTTLILLPLPASVFCLYNIVGGQTGKILIVVGILPPLFILLFYLARNFAKTEEKRDRLALGEDIRQSLGSPASMAEVVERVLTTMERLVDYRWGAVYSLDEGALRLCGEKSHGRPVIVRDPSKVEETGISCGDIRTGQDQVIWPPQIKPDEGTLGRLARECVQPQFFDNGLASDNPSEPCLPRKTALIVLPITPGSQGPIGLIAAARPRRLFTAWDWENGQLLSSEAGNVFLHVQRLERALRELYQKVEDYAKEPEEVRQAIQKLAGRRIDVPKILAAVSERSFHRNLRAVLQGMVEGRRGDDLSLPPETLTEIYNRVRDETRGMPALDPHILQSLQKVTSSLSLAFSFRYQFPDVGRAPAFKELYEFLSAALDANTVSRIVALDSQIVSTVRMVRQRESEGQREIGRAEVITEVENLRDVVRPLREYTETKDSTAQRAALGRALKLLEERERAVQKGLRDPERFVFLQILAGWRTAVTNTVEDLARGPARLKMYLRSNRALPLEKITVALELRNDGPAGASSVVAQLEPAQDYEVLEGERELEALVAGKTEELEFTLRSKGAGPLRLQFRVTYHDPEQEGKVEEFADRLYLLEPPSRFAGIPNPYTPGQPLRPGNPTFMGREDIFDFIRQNIPVLEQKMILVLVGERRTGKTSILQQLPARLGDPRYVPIFVDGQELGIDPGMASFFLSLATAIADGLQKAGIPVTPPTLAELQEGPQHVFERRFLPRVRERIGERVLLLTIDEFEQLGYRVSRGRLPPEIFPYLRHLIQHGEQLAFIFAGTHKIEEAIGDYWSVLFSIAEYKRVGFLEREEAIRLIKEPVQLYGMVYDDLAVDEVLRLTAGHPCFIQLLCDNLVNRCNEAHCSYVTIQNVRDAMEDLLEVGRAHLTFLWQTLDEEAMLALVALAELRTQLDQVSAAAIADRLGNYRIRLSPGQVMKAMEHLEARDIVRRVPGDPVSYDLTAQLYAHWLRRYKPLSKVVEEVSIKPDTVVKEVSDGPATE